MKRSARGYCLALFVVFGVLMGLLTLQPGGPIDLFERGAWLGPASDMLAGKIPFRDTFPVHGFLADGGFDLFLFKLFGPSFGVSVYAHHFLGSFFQASLFLVTAAATRSPIVATLAIPLNLSFTTGLVTDRPVLPLLSLAAFLWALDDPPRRGQAFIAGLLGGVGFLYALDFGTFVVISELCVLGLAAVASRNHALPVLRGKAFLAGVAIPVAAFCGYLVAHEALDDFLKISFLDLPRHIENVWGLPFPAPWDLFTAWLHGSQYAYGELSFGFGMVKRLYLAPLLGVAGIVEAVAFLRRRDLAAALRLAGLSLACLLFFRHVIARLHLEAGNALTGPTFVTALFLLGLHAYAGDARRRALRAALACLAFFAVLAMNLPGRVVAVARTASVGRRVALEGLKPLTVPRGSGILVPRREAAELRTLFSFCSCALPAGARILDLTNRPGLYFFLDRPNATRFYQVPLMQPFESQIVASIDESPPAMVILAGGDLEAPDGVPNRERIAHIWSLVLERYPLSIVVRNNELRFPLDASALVQQCLRSSRHSNKSPTASLSSLKLQVYRQ
ncbi:MAG: hypothetical protein WD451_09435 [Thermoanaerobaculia bacterium]